MTKRAMFKLEVVKFAFEGFVFAGLASVELLGKDALSTSYAGREMTATFTTVYITIISRYVCFETQRY